MRTDPGTGQKGFSLIEIITAIVIMSIISVGLVEFITNSASGYVQTSTRNQVAASGRVIIDRMVMEMHNALPESVRISDPFDMGDENDGYGYAGDQCVEFIPVRAATTYLDPAFRPAAHKPYFDAVHFGPEQDDETGIYAVIYPTSSEQLYSAVFGPDATEAIARVDVDSIDANVDRLTYMYLDNDDMPTAYDHRFRRQSSVDRLFLTDQPVSYCVSGNKLYRYSDYGFNATQALPELVGGGCLTPHPCLPSSTNDPAGGRRVLITDQVDNRALTGGGNGQAFDQIDASRRRNAVIQLELNFSQDGQDVRLNHEILMQITP